MANSFVVRAERSEPQRYWYRLSRFQLNDEHQTLMAGDVFKFTIRVHMNTSPATLLLYSPSQIIPCHTFLQDNQFLRTFLSRSPFLVESLDGIAEAVISDVREFFNVDGVASSSSSAPPSLEYQRREIPLWLEITLFESGLLLATEESLQCFRTIPASDEAIQTSLKKHKVVEDDKSSCPICLEDLDVNAESCTMPCDHVFHQKCIVKWLKMNHVCPVCRYSLPTTLKD